MNKNQSGTEKSSAAPSSPRPVVVYSTIYPRDPHGRSELWLTRELLREYLALQPGWDLKIVIASAHAESLELARALLRQFPSIPGEFLFLETKHAGQRSEEISHCKEQLPRLLLDQPWDWLLFMDADVWTRLSQVDAWMARTEDARSNAFVKIKYTLRDKLSSPAHTLGAYFHHRELLERLEYWRCIFPKFPDGTRQGAPDCNLHDFLESKGCRKIVPEPIATLHFLNQRDAHWYRQGRCLRWRGVRDVHGRLDPRAWEGEPPDGSSTTSLPSAPVAS